MFVLPMKAKSVRGEFVSGSVRVAKVKRPKAAQPEAAGARAKSPQPFLVHALRLRAQKIRGAAEANAAR